MHVIEWLIVAARLSTEIELCDEVTYSNIWCILCGDILLRGVGRCCCSLLLLLKFSDLADSLRPGCQPALRRDGLGHVRRRPGLVAADRGGTPAAPE